MYSRKYFNLNNSYDKINTYDCIKYTRRLALIIFSQTYKVILFSNLILGLRIYNIIYY